jgi:hypothetical protein
MFRKLFLALILIGSPAFAQEMTYTDPTQIPIADQTYTVIQQQTTTPIENIQETGTALTLYDDGVSNSITLPFDFYYYGNLYDSIFVSQNGFISFTSQGNGCCSGNPLPSITQWTEQNAPSFQYINLNNSIFAMWSDLADFNNPGNPYYQAFGDRFVVGWYGIEELGSGQTTCDQTGCYPTGPGNRFTYEITLFANNDFMINYGAFDYNNQTGRTFTSGYQGDQAGESYQIYNGNDPTSLQNTTYLVQSSEVTPPPPPPPPPPPEEPDPPIAPDCVVNPLDPTCIINDINDLIDEPVMLAEETAPVDEEDPVVEEEIIVAEETTEEPQQETLEEMLADNVSDEETEEVMEELVAETREMVDEEKASALSDDISKNVLEAALSVASAAEVAGSTAGSSNEASSSNSSESKSSTTLVAVSEVTADTTLSSLSGSSEVFVDAAKEESSSSESTAGADILEAGRLIGQAALNETLAATTESATESMSQAESVAVTSSSESQIMVAQTETASPVETVVEEQSSSTVEQTTTEQQQESVTEQQESAVLVAENEQQSSNETTTTIVAESTVAEEIVTQTTETPIEETATSDIQVAVTETETEITEMVVDNAQTEESSVTYSDVESAMEVFAANLPSQITAAAEQDELENMIIQQSIASSQQQEETNTFSEAEAVTIASDPALANAFNMAPNMMNLELTGALNQKQEEKSDAELRAEQVVAANKEEQDKINSNYMEADQSGIVAAIGSETDVSSYRSAMLRDNNVWYKPEDIYKNIVIKDNVRGSYFLEKGNTDTYKQMIEEQYK